MLYSYRKQTRDGGDKAMSVEIYEVLALAARYWFLALSAMILLLSFFVMRGEKQVRRRNVGRLPDAGYIGQVVILSDHPNLPMGTVLKMGREGEMGAIRMCDTVLDAPGVANCHCTWRYRENTGMELTLFRGCSLTVNGTRYTFRGAKKPVLVHDSILEIGEVKARFQMFAGVEEVVRG